MAQIVFWSPTTGSDYVFNNKVEKGQLVEVVARAKLSHSSWENKTLEEKVAEVAQEIRNELLKTPDTFTR